MNKMAKAYAINIEPVGVAMLTVISSAIGNTIRISPKKGWVEPPFLWTAIIGPSGSGKTPFTNNFLLDKS